MKRRSTTYRFKALEGIDRPKEMKLIRNARLKSRACLHLRQVFFFLSEKMLKHIGATFGELVMVEFQLSQTDPHPTPYATRSAPDDPAIRLGVMVTGLEGAVYASCDGIQIVKSVNTLVDEMEGRTAEEIERTPRRMLRKTKRYPKMRYT